MCSRHLQKHFSGPMIGLTGKPTGKFRKTYCLQPKQFVMWQTLIAMQAQISARACFSATKVGRHAAVPPFHILLVFCQLHFFFVAGGADTPSIYRHMLFSRSAVKPHFRVWMLQYIREITAVDNMKIEPAMRLMKIPHYQPWRSKLWFDREKSCEFVSVFWKFQLDEESIEGRYLCANYGFRFYSSKGQVFKLFWSSVRCFGRLGWPDDCEYGSLQVIPLVIVFLYKNVLNRILSPNVSFGEQTSLANWLHVIWVERRFFHHQRNQPKMSSASSWNWTAWRRWRTTCRS